MSRPHRVYAFEGTRTSNIGGGKFHTTMESWIIGVPEHKDASDATAIFESEVRKRILNDDRIDITGVSLIATGKVVNFEVER